MKKYLLHSTRAPRLAPVLAVAALLLCGLAAVLPYASRPWPEVPAFFPFYGTLVGVLEGLTAFLLVAQFSRTKILADGLMGSAYGLTGFLAVMQSIIFPGVMAPQGFLGSGPQSAVWMWVFWHLGYPTLILLAMFASRVLGEKPVSKRDYQKCFYLVVVYPLLLGIVISVVCIRYSDMLPVLITGKNFVSFAETWLAKSIWAMNALALIATVFLPRERTVVSHWLGVAMLAAVAEVTLTLVGGTRYSVGWYAARGLSVTSATVVLGALLWEISQLYGAVQRANEELAVLALRDGLTGLYNRRFFDTALDRELAHARQTHQAVSLLLMDIDYFKDFNDIFGHVEGDACLKMVAKAVEQQMLRQGDFVARYGGEEFVVVLPNADAVGAMLVAERIRKAVEGLRIPHTSPRSATGVVTLSIGVAIASTGAEQTAAALVLAADRALYHSKEKGRNQVTAASPEDNAIVC